MKDRTNHALLLRDGRHLSYAEYGHPMGRPLLYFHGIPGSRLECPVDASSLHKQHIRLIVPERPGYGYSDRLENRRILDWPGDVAQLADHLALERFTVLGFSGGGSYALACAHELNERIVATGLLACLAPFDAPGIRDVISPALRGMYELAAKAPEELLQQFAPIANEPGQVLEMVEEAASAPDKVILSAANFRRHFLANVTESLHQGSKAVVWDLHLAASAWGFELAGVEQAVQLWHGTDDRNADLAMGRYLADALPQCRATFMENEGHYSLLSHAERILQELMDF